MNASVERLVVVGGSLAGVRAVEAARQAGFAGSVTMLSAEDVAPYDRPPLSKAMLAPDSSMTPPILLTCEHLTENLEVDLRLGSSATALDVNQRVVHSGGREVPYDALVIATGVAPRRLPSLRAAGGIRELRTLYDAQAVRRALDGGARVAVVGCGFIGSEVASAARQRDLAVVVVEAAPAPLVGALGVETAALCTALHERHGVDLRCGVTVTGHRHEGAGNALTLSDGSVVEADLIVVGIGTVAQTQWLVDSGLALDDGVVCDETLQTSAPDVYAAGDVARWHNPLFDVSMRVEHWSTAAASGRHAGQLAVQAVPPVPFVHVPMFWSDWYGSRLQFVGVRGTDGEARVLDEPDGGEAGDGRHVVLYRSRDRLVGAFALNASAELARYRRLITQRASWTDVLAATSVRS